MEKIRRKIFFWLLALTFLITAPVIVMHARGYRFDLSRGVFVFSGSISLKTNPREITVKLNDEISDSQKLNMINNSYNISGLLPDEYSIEVAAPGFRPWSKKIDVHSGVASEFWNILLVRESYEKTKNNTSGADEFYLSPKNRYIAYSGQSENDLAVGIYEIDSDSNLENFTLSEARSATRESEENIEWSPDEAYLSVPIRINKDQKLDEVLTDYIIIDRDGGQTFSLSEISGKIKFSDVRWDPLQKGFLFFLSENDLFRFDVSKKDLKLIAQEVTGYDVSRTAVYYVKKPNNLIYKDAIEGGQNPIQLTNAFPGPENAIIDKITAYDDSRISLITKEERELYVFNDGEHEDYFRKLAKNIQGTHFSDDGKKLLFWDDYEISVYFLRDWHVQPARTENEVRNITRYSEPIGNVQWFKDYEHIIFSSGRWVKITELDPRDRRNCADILNTQIEDPMVIYSGAQDKLFFSDRTEENSSIFSIRFPEPSPILGIGGE